MKIPIEITKHEESQQIQLCYFTTKGKETKMRKEEPINLLPIIRSILSLLYR